MKNFHKFVKKIYRDDVSKNVISLKFFTNEINRQIYVIIV